MDVAERFSELSSARRLKCGAIVVKDNRIISIGYNGTPAGWDNNCENEVYHEREWQDEPTLETKPEVLHAERNALDKLTCSHESSEGAIMFTTHSPCFECAKSIFNSKIKEVYFRHKYRSDEGIKFLKKCGVSVYDLGIQQSGGSNAT